MMPYIYNSELKSMMQTVLVVMIIVYAIIILAALANYIMQSIALTRVGRRRSIKAPWLIWIPVANLWALGALADEYDGRRGLRRHFRITLLVLVLVLIFAYVALFASLFSSIPKLEALEAVGGEAIGAGIRLVLGMYSGIIVIAVVGVAYTALYYICLYKIFESLDKKNCVLFFVLSLLVPFFQSICLLCLRNSSYPYPENTPALPEVSENGEKGWYDA